MKPFQEIAWGPDLIYTGGAFKSDLAIICDGADGAIRLAPLKATANPTILNNRALLPGLVNAHSHAFQRVIRGLTEHRTVSRKDSFWTWREAMYSAANRLTPEDVYDASRMAFLEMALSGITAIGEFHYLHHAPGGVPYDDPNLLAKEVVRAAGDVGLRIALLRFAYGRAGYKAETSPAQLRFIESEPDVYLQRVELLRSDLAKLDSKASVGLAPHSVRAVSLNYLKAVARFGQKQTLPVHMHVAEQPAEVVACLEEYGCPPVAVLESAGILSERFTAVHAIHVTPEETQTLAQARAMICACPTTERNLGDGVIPADTFHERNLRLSLGTDSNVQIDLLEDARELEYHLRLQKMERAILARSDKRPDALVARLFDSATINGADSIGASSGTLEPGRLTDFFTVDLNDVSLAGASRENLLSHIVFSLPRTAVKDVVVGGDQIVSDGEHRSQDEIVTRFKTLQKRLWS